ncbi:MAG: hypothetical protein HQK83_13805 [Fibrobacteria bacterium]|nr:hypothetical protein [Fibrobacteria bacterium]
MNHNHIFILAFITLLLFQYFWDLFIAYPVVLDNYIKRGQSWLYLPLKWNSWIKKFINFFNPIVFALTLFSGGAALYFNTPFLKLYITIPVFIVLATGFTFINDLLLKKRFHQQEDLYFYVRGKIQKQMSQKGKGLSELEINNLASFQHQNMLREADEKHKFIPELNLQSKQAKKVLKAQRKPVP